MKNYIAVFVVFCFAGLLLTGCGGSPGKDASWSKIEDLAQLKVEFDEQNEKTGFKKGGPVEGFDMEVASEVCRRLGLALKVYTGTSSKMQQELMDGKIDCVWNGLFDPEAAEDLAFTGPIAADQPGAAFRSKDKALLKKIKEALIEMSAEGVLAELSERWLGSDLSGFKEEGAVKKFNSTFIGRFNFYDPYGPVFGWPGSSIKARFVGTGLKMAIRPVNFVDKDNWLNIVIDDQEPVPLHIRDEGIYDIASGLTDGEHAVTVWKRTGASNGELQFLGFRTEDGGKLLSPPSRAARRLEFIGDSIACGYGNEASSAREGYKASEENNYLAFCSIAARELGAEQITVAWSGKGVYRNIDGSTTGTMPELYRNTLPKTEGKWDFKGWVPDAVVINLGTNDFSRPDVDERAFSKAYTDLIKYIRGNYPHTYIFCAAGPMDHRSKSSVGGIVKAFNRQGDKRVYFIGFPLMDVDTEGAGANSHPSVRTHKRIGKQLAEVIREKLGW